MKKLLIFGLLLLLMTNTSYAADSKISALDAIDTPTTSDYLPIVNDDDTSNKKVTVGNLFAVSPDLDATGDIEDNAIDSEHYTDGSIDNEHLADDAVAAEELDETTVAAGSYMSPTITVDEDGRLTYAASGSLTGLSDVGSATQGAGRVIVSDGTSFQSLDITGDIDIEADGNSEIQSAVVGTSELVDTTVTAASYMAPTITVDADGRLTYAASGSITGLTDVESATQGAGRLLVSDGTSFQSLEITGDISIEGDGQVDVPAIGTLTNTKWCTTDGSVINCEEDTPAGGVTDLSDLGDVESSTQGAGRVLMSDGTSFQSLDISGDIDLQGDGEVTVTWGNLAEGELADSTIVSADIKDGEVGAGDIASTTVTAGSYTASVITVDDDGRLTYAASGSLTGLSDVESATQGAGRLLISDGADFDSIAVSGEATIDSAGNVTLADSVTVGSWTLSTPTMSGAWTSSGGDVTFDTTVFHFDDATDSVGIGTSTPTEMLEVAGDLELSGEGNPGIAFDGETADPCGTEPEGFLFYNSTDHKVCYCDEGGDDLNIADDTACF